MIPDIFGAAFNDYMSGNKGEAIEVETDIAENSYIPVAYFFRDFKMMPAGEQKVLKACKGSVLDVGAGAGSHSLYLQNKGCDVTAIDFSMGAAQVMKQRGLEKVFCIDFFNMTKEKYDNILLLMNGAGIARNIEGLYKLLTHAKMLLTSNGCVFIESTDLLYMYEDDEGVCEINLADEYYGEVTYKLKYGEMVGKPFKWLFVDRDNMASIAGEAGFKPRIFYDTVKSNYIMKLTLK